ncbi:MAG: hypothetical protein PHW60_05555 [Kiritimatiellae bacterium]|nr:hypothetical protein [Kiritimatiellia bacterium]
MQQVVMGLMGILIGLAVLIIASGWIVPLILSLIGRRRQWPSAKGLMIIAAVWGGTAILLALGAGGLFFTYSQMSRSYEDNAKLFKAADYGGKTAILRLAYTGAVECVIRDQAGKTFRCVTSNGRLVVPAGTMALRECKLTASDSEGRSWTASCRFWNETNISVGADAVQDVEFGSPFLVAVNMEWAPVSSKIRLDPACADRAGNIYMIAGPKNATDPSFQVLDANQRALWSGKFEAG